VYIIESKAYRGNELIEVRCPGSVEGRTSEVDRGLMTIVQGSGN
jgi:hypothetical protein